MKKALFLAGSLLLASGSALAEENETPKLSPDAQAFAKRIEQLCPKLTFQKGEPAVEAEVEANRQFFKMTFESAEPRNRCLGNPLKILNNPKPELVVSKCHVTRLRLNPMVQEKKDDQDKTNQTVHIVCAKE